jgi:hypothetical protein
MGGMEESIMVRFTVSGHRVELTADDVRHRLSGTRPERIYEYSIRVGICVYPVKQAFEVATGIPRSEFTTQTARRHLAALGFVIAPDRSRGRLSSSHESSVRANTGNVTEASRQSAISGDWHTEANVQAMVVAYLEREG